MNCIIVDDEPLAREGIEQLVRQNTELTLSGTFNGAKSAGAFLQNNTIDLVFLDIQMPGTTGMEFARSIGGNTLVIFTPAYSEYALESYEVDAIDYLLKPLSPDLFHKAVQKAITYHRLLLPGKPDNQIEAAGDYFFVKTDRTRIAKIDFTDILFIEGLKDYVVIHTARQKIITAMNIKTIHEQLPPSIFIRISKSYLINVQQLSSFDNNSVFIQQHEIPIGNAYRTRFFADYVSKKLLSRDKG